MKNGAAVYLFAFPEKYWKLMNGYYNARKSFFPVKNLEKLEKLIEMNSARKIYIYYTLKYYGIIIISN